MTKHAQYSCNICGDPVVNNALRDNISVAFGLHIDDGRIIGISEFNNAQAHICKPCTDTLSRMTAEGSFQL